MFNYENPDEWTDSELIAWGLAVVVTDSFSEPPCNNAWLLALSKTNTQHGPRHWTVIWHDRGYPRKRIYLNEAKPGSLPELTDEARDVLRNAARLQVEGLREKSCAAIS
jgi:hypothetical protein